MSWMNVPGGEIEPSVQGNFGSRDSKIVCFVACGASFLGVELEVNTTSSSLAYFLA